MAIKRIIGIAGVPLDAPYKAQVWGKRFDLGLLVILAILVIRWYLEKTLGLPHVLIRLCSWLVWGFFVAELLVITPMVEDKKRYLLRNWANWIIIVFGFPLFKFHSVYLSIIRLPKLLIAARFSKPFVESGLKVLAKRHWQSTMLVLLALIFISALVLSVIDPAFRHIGEGLWFAWESVTTVGYGDVVPHTFLGKLFTSIIILFGVILISMMTASFSAFIIGKEDERKKEGDVIEKHLEEIKQQLQALEIKVGRIENTRVKSED